MDYAKVLAELRQELDNLDAAIRSLERLQAGKRRGRPPAWITGKAPSPAPGRRRSRNRDNDSDET